MSNNVNYQQMLEESINATSIALMELEQKESHDKQVKDKHLEAASLLKAIHEATSNLQSVAASPSTASSGPSAAEIIQVLGYCAEVVSLLQLTTMQSKTNETNINNTVSSAIIALQKGAQQQAENNLQQINNEIAQENSKPWWETLLTVLTFVAAFVTMVFDPVAGAIMLVMATLQQTGVLQSITNDISSDLQKDGLSQDEANMISSIIVTVMITAVTMGQGIGGASLSDVASVADNTAQSTLKQLASKLASVATNKATFLAMDGLATGMSSTNLMTNIATYIIDNDPAYSSNPNAKAKALEIVAIMQAVLATLMTMSSAAGIYGISKMGGAIEDTSIGAQAAKSIKAGFASDLIKMGFNPSYFVKLGWISSTAANTLDAASTAAESQKATSKLLFNFIKNDGPNITSNFMNFVAGSGFAAADIYKGTIEKKIADLDLNNGYIQADLVILNNEMNNITSIDQNQMQSAATLEKAQAGDLTSMVTAAEITSSAIAQATLTAV